MCECELDCANGLLLLCIHSKFRFLSIKYSAFNYTYQTMAIRLIQWSWPQVLPYLPLISYKFRLVFTVSGWNANLYTLITETKQKGCKKWCTKRTAEQKVFWIFFLKIKVWQCYVDDGTRKDKKNMPLFSRSFMNSSNERNKHNENTKKQKQPERTILLFPRQRRKRRRSLLLQNNKNELVPNKLTSRQIPGGFAGDNYAWWTRETSPTSFHHFQEKKTNEDPDNWSHGWNGRSQRPRLDPDRFILQVSQRKTANSTCC